MIKYNWTNQQTGQKALRLMNNDEIMALGASLRLINQRLLSQDTSERDTTRVWYQGGEPYFDLFVELCQDNIQWFQFTWRGHSISWNTKSSCWYTGKTNELRTDDSTFYPSSKLIEGDKQPDLAFIELAHAILQTRAGEEIFDKILALLDTRT